MSHYIFARDKFKPDKIVILIVAESPPASGGYFYFEKASGRDSFFRETMKALNLLPKDKKLPRGSDKTAYLKEFQSRGYFVVDVSYEPVNNMKRGKVTIIKKNMSRLVSDVQELDPEKIVIVKKNLFIPVKTALVKAGFGERILNDDFIPFPSHGWQKKFREMISQLVFSKRKNSS